MINKTLLDVGREIETHRQYAKNMIKKDKRVNIRISSWDLAGKLVERRIPEYA